MSNIVKGSLTTTGTSDVLRTSEAQGYVNISIRDGGSLSGTVDLEVKYEDWPDGGWGVVESFTTFPVEKINYQPQAGASMRLVGNTIVGTALYRMGQGVMVS